MPPNNAPTIAPTTVMIVIGSTITILRDDLNEDNGSVGRPQYTDYKRSALLWFLRGLKMSSEGMSRFQIGLVQRTALLHVI